MIKSDKGEVNSHRADLIYLDVNLISISKMSSEIFDRGKCTLTNHLVGDLQEVRNFIYDKFPALYLSGDYKIFWQYSKEQFLEIYDVITYLAAIKCMASATFYFLINDFEEVWDDNLTFLLELDRIEEEERKEKERDIYDVKIARKIDLNVAFIETAQESSVSVQRKIRTESEILAYAIRNEPPIFCYTTDARMGAILVRDMQKGYPKTKVKLRIHPDIVFEKRAKDKDTKGAKSKDGGKGKNKSKKKK